MLAEGYADERVGFELYQDKVLLVDCQRYALLCQFLSLSAELDHRQAFHLLQKLLLQKHEIALLHPHLLSLPLDKRLQLLGKDAVGSPEVKGRTGVAQVEQFFVLEVQHFKQIEMFPSRQSNFVGRSCSRRQHVALSLLRPVKNLLDQSSVKLRAVFSEVVGAERVRKKSPDDLFGRLFLDPLLDVSVDLEPGLLQQAGPHVYAFDRLREERHLSGAEHIVVDVDELPATAHVHSDHCYPV